jgi:hypothetical protein
MKPSIMLIGAAGDCNDMEEFVAIEATDFDKLCGDLDRQYDEMREKVERCIQAPVDRDGVPIKPGDVIDSMTWDTEMVEEVRLGASGSVTLCNKGGTMLLASPDGVFNGATHRKDSFADIIRDAADGASQEELVRRCEKVAGMMYGE